MFISWFTYTTPDSGSPNQQHWYTAQGGFAGNPAVLTLHETVGGEFNGPQEVTTSAIGQVFIEFEDCETGTMSYIFDDGREGSFPMLCGSFEEDQDQAPFQYTIDK